MNKLNNIKYIFLDIDNTLTNSKKNITKYTISIFKKIKIKGIKIILCTGRTNQYAIEMSKRCNCGNIVISDNGSLIYNYENNKVLYSNPIPKDAINTIQKISYNNNIDCALNAIKTRYKLSIFKNNDYIKTKNFIKDLNELNENITQIVINSKEKEKLQKAKEQIEEIGNVKVTNTNINKNINNKSYFCDINMKENSKGKAIKILKEILNMKEDEIICFGDSMNDYSMIESCKYSVAMKNADEKLKEKTYFITEYTNDEDGVAKFIEENIL